jgi:coniferyl-aldehyde dehydrogenase
MSGLPAGKNNLEPDAGSGVNLQSLLDVQRCAFERDMVPSYATRRDRLDRLLSMTERIGNELIAAISLDFGYRSPHVTRLTDLMMVAASIKHARRHLARWMKVRRVPTGLSFLPGRSLVMRQPLGVVGIVAPWNYPYQLTIGPAIAALAAGNRVLAKPSELTPRFSDLLRAAVRDAFHENEFAVVTGGPAVAKAFVALPFDHILFTGSTAVGKQVALAAAANLTPVTLELGGKSPAILHSDCDLPRAARQLVTSKLINAGQTCIAPDYVAVPQSHLEPFIVELKRAVGELYPALEANPDYTSIISDAHVERLAALLSDATSKGARVIPLASGGGSHHPRMMAPSLVLDVHQDMHIMRHEIFGPILPVIVYSHLDEMLDYINAHDRPLALYWFGKDPAVRDRVLRNTISGGVTINDCLWHFGQEELPFGGVGASGMGAYHGETGFRTFSKEKPVFHQSRLSGVPLLYPPYGRTFDFMAKVLRRIT